MKNERFSVKQFIPVLKEGVRGTAVADRNREAWASEQAS